MGREVDSIHQFEHSPKFRLAKEMTVVRCDDGTVYEFERPADRPDSHEFRLTHAFQPNGEMTHTGARKILPEAVEETVETVLGGWSK